LTSVKKGWYIFTLSKYAAKIGDYFFVATGTHPFNSSFKLMEPVTTSTAEAGMPGSLRKA
jgi:hypothetical protein